VTVVQVAVSISMRIQSISAPSIAKSAIRTMIHRRREVLISVRRRSPKSELRRSLRRVPMLAQ
jgi:hypothetical protein